MKTISKDQNKELKIITPQDKDLIVDAIIGKKKVTFNFRYEDVPLTELSKEQFQLVINQLIEMKLIDHSGYLDGGKVTVRAEMYDFYNHGKFWAQEQLLKTNLEKLGYELDALSKIAYPELTDRLVIIGQIAASITAVLPLLR